MKYTCLLYVLIFIANSSFAQWPALSTPNVQVTSSVSSSGNLKDYWACTDGVGGSFSFFTDDRQDNGGGESIYCQRIDKNGNVKFTVSGVAIGAVPTADQDKPKCSEDGFNNAIAAWEDDRLGNDDIYAQKIDSSGTVQWTVNGVVICNATGNQKDVWVVSDDSGGAILAWEDDRGADKDIYAQRVDSDGVVKWTANGVVISSATDDQKKLHLVEDGAGGAIITWEDNRGADKDIYAQHINAAGVVQWTANGVVISNASNDQDRPKVTTDGANGAIISWTDQRGTAEDIYAQRVNSAGSVQWTDNGIVISSATDVQDRSTIISDQSNGAVIVWEDERSGTTIDIYAQRVNSSGTVQWTANGIVVSNAADDQQNPHVSPGSFGKTLIVWEDARTAGTEDIYIQVLTLNGDTLVTANGLAVCTSTDVQKKPFIFRNADTDWIVLWEDDRNTAAGQTDLYAQGINPSIIPALPIELLFFKAKRNAKVVNLNWSTATEINNNYFTVEKSHDVTYWKALENISGAGNSREVLVYSQTDESPFDGVSYYRLKQTDFDGQFSYSNIVAVKMGEDLIEKVYPQPASDILIVSLKENVNSIKIYNTQGTILLSEDILFQNIFKVDISDLTSGVYFISVSSDIYIKTFKFMVEK